MRSILTLLLFCLLPSAVTAAAPAKITLTNGLSQTGVITSADARGVMWNGRGSAPRQIAHSTIDEVEFVTPEAWKEANAHFYQGDFEKAIASFAAIANNAATYYYPAPGNYTSKAMLRLVDCYRASGDTAALLAVAERIDPNALAVQDRPKMAMINAWAALGREDWDAALSLTDAIPDDPLIAGNADRAYIRGVALEKTERPEEAIVAYAGAYSLEFGSQSGIAKRALQKSVLLLQALDDAERLPEHRAVVHAYAHVFNEGALWASATTLDRELLTQKIEMQTVAYGDGEDPESPAIALRFRKNEILQRGKTKQFAYDPPLAKPDEDAISSTTLADFSSVGVDLKIDANSDGALQVDPLGGLGVDAAMDQNGESLTFSVTGVKAFRILAIRFGGGSPEFELNPTDRVTLKATGLIPGQSGYAESLSAPPSEKDDEGLTSSEGFQRLALSGGFIAAEEGTFTISHGKGSFGIDEIALELRASAPAASEEADP